MDKESAGRMEFTFQSQEHAARVVVTLSPQADLNEVFDAFENFLHAAGYVFHGTIDIVNYMPQGENAEFN